MKEVFFLPLLLLCQFVCLNIDMVIGCQEVHLERFDVFQVSVSHSYEYTHLQHTHCQQRPGQTVYVRGFQTFIFKVSHTSVPFQTLHCKGICTFE